MGLESSEIDNLEEICPHESHHRDWLPVLDEGDYQTPAPHPYCEKCGLVKSIGPDRPRKIGYFIDGLDQIERHLSHEDKKDGRHRLIAAQKRLIVKEVEEDELFRDLWGTYRSAQEERFVEIVRKYRPDLKEEEIEYYFE